MEQSNEIVGKIVEGYRIIKFLGRGKFSIVYQAERQADSKLVALKIIKIYKKNIPKIFKQKIKIQIKNKK